MFFRALIPVLCPLTLWAWQSKLSLKLGCNLQQNYHSWRIKYEVLDHLRSSIVQYEQSGKIPARNIGYLVKYRIWIHMSKNKANYNNAQWRRHALCRRRDEETYTTWNVIWATQKSLITLICSAGFSHFWIDVCCKAFCCFLPTEKGWKKSPSAVLLGV